MFLLSKPNPAWYAASPEGSPALSITYLGTAGFVFQDEHRTIVVDPYITRAPVGHLLFRTLHPKAALLHALIPKADDVLVGHAHFDHVLDAPVLCQQTHARMLGASASMMVGRAAGLSENQLLETQGNVEIASGRWVIRGVPSIHGKAIFGRVPIPGNLEKPPVWPARFYHLKHGLVLNWFINTGKLKVLHIDSADFLPEELRDTKVDVVCLCAIGRSYRPNYVREIISLTQPRWVIPCHWDTMMTHIGETPDLIPGISLEGFLQELRAEGVTPLLMPLLGRLTLPATL